MSELTQGHLFSVICYSEDHYIPVLHVNTCLSCMVQLHSLSIVLNICALPTINLVNFALHPKNLSVHRH